MDAFIQKMDINGDFEWVKQLSFSYANSSLHVKLANSGNIYVLGRYHSNSGF